MKKLLFVLLAGMLMLTGCGGGNDDKSGEAPKSNDESSTELSTKEVSAKLREINDWYVTDIWNVGLCDIGYYTSSGTSATGEELDIELTLKQYNEAIAKLEEYNNEIKAKSGLDLKTDKLSQYQTAFQKYINALSES